MVSYRTDSAELARLVEKAEQLTARIDERLGAIDNRIAGLHMSWTGTAADAHRSTHDSWLRAARHAHEALTALHTAVSEANNRYTENVAHNQRMWPS